MPNNAAIALAAAPLFSSMALYVATETNPTIVQGLKDRCAGAGFSLEVPYILSQRVSQAGAGVVSSTMRLNRGMGSALLRMF